VKHQGIRFLDIGGYSGRIPLSVERMTASLRVFPLRCSRHCCPGKFT
jgi:hypothetical protein